MLRRARRRIDRAAWDNVELVRGDAALLEGVGGPFDAVMSTWALGIVDDLPGALRRAVEVLRPGGRLAILDFQQTRPDAGLHRLLHPVYLRVLRPSGADTPEDLDDERLRERWRAGRQWLSETLVDLSVETYFHGTGFLLSGTRPA